MDLSYIPNMNADVENIINQFKLDLEAFDTHKKQMINVLTQLKKKLKCVKCKNYNKEYHIVHNNFIQSPLCPACFKNITHSILYACPFYLLDFFDD